MRSIGIDIGSRYVKAVAVSNGGDKGFGCVPIRGDMKASVKKAICEAAAAVPSSLFEKTKYRMTGTGHAGKTLYPFSSPSQCLARSAFEFAPNGGIIIDAGAMVIEGIILSHKGKIIDTGKNERCSAGGGRFIEIMAKALGVEFSQIDSLFEKSSNPYAITSGCIVFAESEIVTQVNAGKKLEDIVAGMITLIAGKAATVCDILTEKEERPVFLSGGLSKFKTLQKEFERLSGVKCGKLSVDPIFTSAYGAALIARDGK